MLILIQNFHIQVHPYIQVHKSGRNRCIFCRGNHWSDKCSVTDFQAKKDFSKKEKRCFFCLKPDHLSRNCTKTKPCYYCKGMHNSDICNDRNKQGNQTPTLCITCFVYFVTNCRYYLRKLKCCVRHLFVFPQKKQSITFAKNNFEF